ERNHNSGATADRLACKVFQLTSGLTHLALRDQLSALRVPNNVRYPGTTVSIPSFQFATGDTVGRYFDGGIVPIQFVLYPRLQILNPELSRYDQSLPQQIRYRNTGSETFALQFQHQGVHALERSV